MKKTFDGSLEYEVRWKVIPPRCNLRLYQSNALAVAIFSQPFNYQGLSVTNGAEHIASEVLNRFKLDPWRTLWIEHYPEGTSIDGDHMDLVTFHWVDQSLFKQTLGSNWQAEQPKWTRVGPKWLWSLIGEEIR